MKTYTAEAIPLSMDTKVWRLRILELLPSFLARAWFGGPLYALLAAGFYLAEFARKQAKRLPFRAVKRSCQQGFDGLQQYAVIFLFFLLAFMGLCGRAAAQGAFPRVANEIDSQQRVTLAGSHSPMAVKEHDTGRVSSDKQIKGIALVLSRTADQETALLDLIAAQQNPKSSQYHKWLTPETFAARFGVADSDIETIEAWLQQQGFAVSGVSRSKNRITFSGTVGQVESAFETQIHSYKTSTRSDATTDFAPSTDISIPSALASVVQSVSNLSSFRPKARVKFKTAQKSSSPAPEFTSGQSTNHYLSPQDVATIYDINPAYNAGYTGTGQVIAVVGQSDVELSDIENFQKAAGFTVKDPTLVLVPNSGTATYYTGGDESESDLDLEYTSTIAKGATIDFVYTGSNQNYGVFDSLQYAIDTKLAPIISISYGECETALGSTDYATYNAILAQAAAQGQSVIAASGDSGSTDCYDQTSLSTSQMEALAVDFPASSQYVTGMGGTEFPSTDVAASNTTYWDASTGSDVVSTAKSYIPEQVWNDDSSSSGLSSGGGGTSTLTSRPSWQAGVTGISSGSYRLVPDISLDASPDNAGYLFCSSDSSATGVTGSCSNGFRDSNDTYLTVAGGTSFAAPIFAGMLALINQKINSTGQGVIDPTLYQLAASSSTYASAFHDITSGSNECTAGSSYCSGSATSEYPATTGYDEATGLGSVDLYNLLSAWPTPSSTSTLAASTTTLTAATTTPASGASDLITITVASNSSTESATPTGTLSVAVDGTTVNSSLALSAGEATYTFSSTTSGTHVVTATYSGDATYATSTGTITLTIGSTTGTTSGSGGSGTTTVSVTPSGGFTGTVDLSISTASTTLQQDACYDLASASVTGTAAVSETLTIYLGSSNCQSAQLKNKVHSFKAAAQTSSRSSAPGHPFERSLLSLAGVFAVGLFSVRGRRIRATALAVLCVASGLFVSGCGSSSSSSSTSKSFTVSDSPTTMTISAGSSGVPTGSYSLTITGTSSSLTSSASLTLTVD